jgi:hypothetical protein
MLSASSSIVATGLAPKFGFGGVILVQAGILNQYSIGLPQQG